MLPNFPTAAFVTDLDPLIITAPTIRSGTTLVQRILCSSSRSLIFGELIAHDLEFFLNLYTAQVQSYTYKRHIYDRDRAQVVSGNTDAWIPDLMPDLDGYVTAFGHAAFAGIAYCRDYARGLGRPVWGFKYPSWKPAFIRLLHTVIPHARFIAILRELEPCVRSAKSQSALDSLPQVTEFCQAWVEGMKFWRNIGDDPTLLVLNYEELVAQPELTLQRLAEFTGLTDIKSEVLQHKINTWTGNLSHFEAPGGYLPPAELTESEQKIVDEANAVFRKNVSS